MIHVGKDYPGGLDLVRRKAKEHFLSNAHVADEGACMHSCMLYVLSLACTDYIILR